MATKTITTTLYTSTIINKQMHQPITTLYLTKPIRIQTMKKLKTLRDYKARKKKMLICYDAEETKTSAPTLKRREKNPSMYDNSSMYRTSAPYVVAIIIFDTHVRNTIKKSPTAPTATASTKAPRSYKHRIIMAKKKQSKKQNNKKAPRRSNRGKTSNARDNEGKKKLEAQYSDLLAGAENVETQDTTMADAGDTEESYHGDSN